MKQKLLYLFLFLTINTISFAQVAYQPDPLQVCDDDNDGFALFDLTYADAQVFGAQSAIDFTITYHETQSDASNGTNAINGSYINIISWFQTLYVRLEANATGNFATTELTLVVINTSEFTAEIISNDVFFSDTDSDPETPVEANLCGFGSVTIETNSPLADGFIWYRNGFEMFGETSSSLVVTQSDVYQVAAFYNQCGSVAFSQLVVLNLYEEATVIDPQTIMACDNSSADGTADFNLDDLSASLGLGDEFVISYYTSTTDANQAINSVVNSYNSAGEILIIRVEDIDAAADGFLGCRSLSTVNLVVNPIPVAVFPTALSLCDDSTNDEIAVFDLTVKDAEITNGNTDWSVTYYETNADAQAQTNVITNPTAYTNSSINGYGANPQTLFVVVTDINTGCVDYTTLTIRVLPNPFGAMGTPSDIMLCDDDNDGITDFDLTLNEGEINPSGESFTLSYFINEADALGNFAPLDPTNFTNVSNPQTIYVRVEGSSGCFALTNFDIYVNTLPEIYMESNYSFCTGGTLVLETGLSGFDNYFEWDFNGNTIQGANLPSLTVTEPGEYAVMLYSSDFGCSSITHIIVEEFSCTDTDDDGVIDSDEDINGNGNLEDDDTDGDDIPNYLDSDDDGDNVATIDEINIVLGRSNNTIHQFVDTDNDEIENYLDDDDDGDGILTIDEDYNDNGDPTDDDTNDNTIPDYLESSVALSLNEFNVTRFNMFPNPAKENVTIQLASSNFETGNVNIFNIQGKAILKPVNFEGNSSILDISSLESGLYFVELTIGNTSTVQKLIVN
ncbi:T9SS type A sorting domain-containing protein [Winogradskyella helgolandensis]|uniref:T9SS type A sorting domain-containing protein n=1 Tax=Winogradskyella helgolandensis TaxID=2697010 RepID=UPI0015BC5EC2|nr:T9SS type A sorting domain-containing protein [Winogradskyella helgolandensis]